MSGDFMLILQDLIPEIIPGLLCHMNMGLILNSHEDKYLKCSFTWKSFIIYLLGKRLYSSVQ